MNSFKYAFKQSVPVIVTYIFLGIASGILMTNAGYGPIWSFLSAVFIYAGSMQIVMVSILTADMPILSAGLMALFINSRHIFYGIGFIDEFRSYGKLKGTYMALAVTDETYTLLSLDDYPNDVDRAKARFYTVLICHIAWITGCTLGGILGGVLPFDSTGIDFAATAMFTAVVVEQWRSAKTHIPAITGITAAIVFYFIIGPDNFILPALSASVVMLMVLRDRILVKERGAVK